MSRDGLSGWATERKETFLSPGHSGRMPPQTKDLCLSSILGLSESLSPHLLHFPCSYFIPLQFLSSVTSLNIFFKFSCLYLSVSDPA